MIHIWKEIINCTKITFYIISSLYFEYYCNLYNTEIILVYILNHGDLALFKNDIGQYLLVTKAIIYSLLVFTSNLIC